MTTSSPTVLQLDRNASALLDLLVELGHLDEKLLTEVNDHLLNLHKPDGQITVDDVRRTVAIVIFDAYDTLPSEFQYMLEAEWGVLFH